MANRKATNKTRAASPELPLGSIPEETLPQPCVQNETTRRSTAKGRSRKKGQDPTAADKDQTVFFMPVAPIRTQVFLTTGLLFPALYDLAKTATQVRDSQSRDATSITLFRDPIQPPVGELLLEVLLTAEEVMDATPRNNGLALHWPIPVSRLLRINVPRAMGTPETYLAGWTFPDVPVPTHLFSALESTAPVAQVGETDPSRMDESKATADIAEAIARYNKYMGMFAYLRNGSRYFSENQSRYADYPATFFALATNLTDVFGNPFSEKSVLHPLLTALLDTTVGSEFPVNAFVKLVNEQPPCIQKEVAKELARQLYSATGGKELVGQAFKTLFDMGDYKTSIQHLQGRDIPHELAILATLYRFSNRQSNDHLTIKQRFHSDWTELTTAMETLAVLGAYYGYAMLPARETKLYSVNSQIDGLIDPTPAIKFHLVNRFERQLIESIYQWAFFRRKTSKDALRYYDQVKSPPPPRATRPRGVFIEDNPVTVSDLTVHRYTITWLGRLLQRLGNLPGETITDNTHIGRYLYRDCVDHPEAEKMRKRGTTLTHYSIPKDSVIDMVAEGKIQIPEKILDALLDEDEKVAVK